MKLFSKANCIRILDYHWMPIQWVLFCNEKLQEWWGGATYAREASNNPVPLLPTKTQSTHPNQKEKKYEDSIFTY